RVHRVLPAVAGRVDDAETCAEGEAFPGAAGPAADVGRVAERLDGVEPAADGLGIGGGEVVEVEAGLAVHDAGNFAEGGEGVGEVMGGDAADDDVELAVAGGDAVGVALG